MNRLKEEREKRGISRKEVAENIGISLNLYGKYERGDNEPKKETWEKLADFFRVDVTYLMGLSDFRDQGDLIHAILKENDDVDFVEVTNLLKKYSIDDDIHPDLFKFVNETIRIYDNTQHFYDIGASSSFEMVLKALEEIFSLFYEDYFSSKEEREKAFFQNVGVINKALFRFYNYGEEEYGKCDNS